MPNTTKKQSHIQNEINKSLSSLTKDSGKEPTTKMNKTTRNKKKNKKVENQTPTKIQLHNTKNKVKDTSI